MKEYYFQTIPRSICLLSDPSPALPSISRPVIFYSKRLKRHRAYRPKTASVFALLPFHTHPFTPHPPTQFPVQLPTQTCFVLGKWVPPCPALHRMPARLRGKGGVAEKRPGQEGLMLTLAPGHVRALHHCRARPAPQLTPGPCPTSHLAGSAAGSPANIRTPKGPLSVLLCMQPHPELPYRPFLSTIIRGATIGFTALGWSLLFPGC